MKKLIICMLLAFSVATFCFAEESKNRYELFEGTIQTTMVGNTALYEKATFLLDTYTGVVYIYSPQNGWVLTPKESAVRRVGITGEQR